MIACGCQFQQCPHPGVPICDQPLTGTVGAGGVNTRTDVLLVQQLLNSVDVAQGGPDAPLNEDGMIGPKTRAAIGKYQQKVLGWNDSRVDPNGPTLRSLLAHAKGGGAVPLGKVGLPLKSPLTAKGSKGVVPEKQEDPELGRDILTLANGYMVAMAGRLARLRAKLAFQSPAVMALLSKHFGTKKEKVTAGDAAHVLGIVASTHTHVARQNAFGKYQAADVLVYTPGGHPSTANVIAYTTRGGNKMSTKQTQLYLDNGVLSKYPGHSIWLTSLFASELSYEKHWVLLHEFCHYVGPRDGHYDNIDDYGYAFEPKFLKLDKFRRLHNAESLALFMLEYCVGTKDILTLPRMNGIRHEYQGSPHVTPGGEIVA